MNIAIRSFKGIAPKIEPRYLPDGAAQVAINVVAEGQSVRPMRGTKSTGATVSFQTLVPGIVPTIYKAGADETGDTRYWLSSYADVSVCRNQIAGDTCEWTFFADKGTPTEVTNKTGWESQSGQLPAVLWRLGIPAPEAPLTGWVDYVTPDTTPAELVIDSEDLAQLVTWNPYSYHPKGFHVSIDKGANWFYPQGVATLAGARAGVRITATDLSRLDVSFDIQVSIDNGVHSHAVRATSNSAAGVAAALASIRIGSDPVVDTTLPSGGHVDVSSRVAGQTATLILYWIELPAYNGGTVVRSGAGTALSPAVVRTALLGTVVHTGSTTYTATGSNYYDGVVVTTNGVATGVKLTSKPFCQVGSAPNPAFTTPSICLANGGTWIPDGENRSISVKWGEEYADSKAATGTTENKGSYESRVYVYTWIYISPCGSWTWESAPSPPSEVANVFADSTVYVQRRTGEGTCSISALTTQQACSLAGGTWTHAAGSVLEPPPGYLVNGLRLYRSVAGQYLLVTEGNVTDTDYTDNKTAAELGEPCPSITWSPPPSRVVSGASQYLDGIINLPNGMVAGFLGRDVYFCEPYRPFAWPENYIQTLDDPVVGLGRMDTTLAVLTTGSPYFIQGSEPSNMNVVKGDLEQSCVSKRSIVSMGRQVFYASPDGLVMLTPGGSSVVTEALFDRTYWQALQPASIHAYGHDNKYVAFFGQATIPLTGPNGAVYQVGGFVLDTASKQFYLHGFTARAGYHDLRNDTLYLATTTSPSTIVKWGQGAPVATGAAVWRSKMFGLPQGTGFSCGQVEAGPLTVARDGAARAAYPLTLRVYADGALFHTQTITNQEHYDLATKLLLSRRAPFRLPPLSNAAGNFIGRDWEIELDVDSEIFNVALAQSMSEIASV